MNTARRRHPGLNLRETSDTAAHERAAALLFGFWVFLMADLVIFALLFVTYAVMSRQGIATGPSPHDFFELRMPLAETAVLLVSSLTCGFTALALKYDAQKYATMRWLSLTLALGVVFVALEVMDFHTFIAKGAGPGVSGFLSAYFLLTGTHAVHVASGIIWGLILLLQLQVFGLVPVVQWRLMRLALFWHMLDVVWIGIFTVVYLQGRLA